MGLIFLLALVIAFALWWWQSGMVPFWEEFLPSDEPVRTSRSRQPPSQSPSLVPPGADVAPTPPGADAAPDPSAAQQNPLPPFAGLPPGTSLPPVERSDGMVAQALASDFRLDQLTRFMNMQDYVRRLVITVDNLPRELVPSQMSMVQRIPGQLDVRQDGDVITLDPRNEARYDGFVRFVEALDPRMVVAVYLQFYPLLDRTYKELGTPQARFHDRVIVAIDDLLAAPTPVGPIELVQPRVLYRFADPALQRLSAGQKIMIRVGPDHADRLKRVLRRLRAALLGQQALN